jgi:hypothetical protein
MEIKNNKTNESSLSRLWRHAQGHDTGTISAFRYAPDCGTGDPYTLPENQKRNKSLKNMLLAKGYGVTEVDGVYIENYGTKNARPVKEKSFFVVDVDDTGNLKDDLIKFGKAFDQDSITYSTAKGEYFLISSNECETGYPGNGKIGVETRLGTPMFGEDGEFHSVIKGRPFVFKESKNFSTIRNYSIAEIRSIKESAKESMKQFGLIENSSITSLKNIHDSIKKKNTPNLINEVSITKILRTIKEIKATSFCIISANVKNRAKQDNELANSQLEQKLKSLQTANDNVSFYNIEGYWSECMDKNYTYTSCPTDMIQDNSEDAFFVLNIDLEQAIDLGGKFEQNVIIYYGGETQNKVSIVDCKTKEIYASYGPLSANVIRQAYSKLKDGRTFSFEGFVLK